MSDHKSSRSGPATQSPQQGDEGEPHLSYAPRALPLGYYALYGITPPAAVQAKHTSPGSSIPAGLLQFHGVIAPAGGAPVQAKAEGHPEISEAESVHQAAAHGTSGAAEQLPYLDEIQRSFGEHDVRHVQAHTGAAATEGAQAMGAEAFTTGDHVAFAHTPSLHTAAHEAAHVVQQRAGVQLKGGVGEAGDAYERHADAVADAVVQGRSSEALLDTLAGPARPTAEAPALAAESGAEALPAAGRNNALGQTLAQHYAQKLQRKPSGTSSHVQLRAANGVSVSGMRFNPRELKDDGATTTTATVQYSNRALSGSAKVNWSLVGDAFGSTVSADGVITPGTDTVPFKVKDKALLRVKAVDSKEAGAWTEGTVPLWSQTVLKAKDDHTKFVAGSYPGAPALGKFDAKYVPARKLLQTEMKLEFKWFDDNPLDPKDKWTPKRKTAYQQKFIQQARAAWNAKFTFNNVRDPQSVWKKLNPVRLDIKITPVAAGGHYVVEAHRHTDQPHKTDADEWASRAALHGGTTLKLMQGNEKRDRDFNTADVIAGEQKRVDRILPGPITFAKDSAALAANAKLDFFATYLKRIHHPKIDVNLIGHAATGEAKANTLSRQRAQAVAAALRTAGVVHHPVRTSAKGDTGAAATVDWQKVDLSATLDPSFKRNPFDTVPHEFGHLLGLGDEYPYNVGDKPAASDHYNLVKEAFSQDYADQVAKQADEPSANVMFYGNDVRVHDYVTFWSALADATSHAAVPVPPLDRKDWKING